MFIDHLLAQAGHEADRFKIGLENVSTETIENWNLLYLDLLSDQVSTREYKYCPYTRELTGDEKEFVQVLGRVLATFRELKKHGVYNDLYFA